MQPPLQVTENVAVQRIWPVPTPQPPAGPVTCGIVAEHQALTLGCGASNPITKIVFASFGTPGGYCPNHLAKGGCDSNTTLQIVENDCLGKTTCSVNADTNVFGDPCHNVVKGLAVQIECTTPPTPPPPPMASQSFIADFGKEAQGGLRLMVSNGTAGQTVNIACGEALQGNTVEYTWGWEFNWTLRDGAQVLEQHKYMECRFVALTFSGTAPDFTLSAWVVNYPWAEEDSTFTSSNATLNAVWELCRYTVHAAALDTYTDSNTRERRPYEADGIIAASGRLMVQRDFLWARHSHAFVIQNPTWPVEWQQITPFLGWQDYQATGQPDLALAFTEQMYNRTKISFLDSFGLLESKLS